MREIILIRHGQSTANAEGVWQGQLDYPLSKLGREQARYAGEALRGVAVHSFYASPLVRAFETAQIVARSCGYEGAVVPVAELTERGGGLFEGNTWPEREREMPDIVARFREASEEEGWSIIGAETDPEILARFAPAIHEILSRLTTGERTVIVSHGGVMRAYLRDIFGPDVLADGERAGNASITRVLVGADGAWELASLADTSHIPKAGEPVVPKDEPVSE
ncbi:histidine phosphatase family protein [Rubrobacter indicoceani]|uniref:histidine phosphatase family protein n=1 Tax=Rubrobacter indicoceani TaxID=2051957 RepID=UPI000E5A71FE|nr:histidine phosphatase family protein [Rubrobacter indicoceani]